MVYGVTAVYGAFHWQRFGGTTVEYADYTASSGETDRQTAERVAVQLGLTLAMPVQSFAIQHDPSGKLLLDFYHANGRHKVTVLPDENRVRIEVTRNSFARYADILHMTTAAFRSGDWRMQFWAYYNEVALWCFVGMLMSAAWMAVVRFQNLAGCWSSALAKIRTLHVRGSGGLPVRRDLRRE